jgi:outer membrane protein OmpA-like peptidoglycan-associated protein
VVKTDTILVPTVYEKTDYKGGDIDTVTKDNKKVLQFNDYEALEFETGSAKINPKSYPYLNYLVNILKKNPSYKISFEGHTDNVGDEQVNTKLAEDRVNAVKAYFVSKGINENRIATKSFGSKKPKYKNDTAAGRAKNRRVEIYMEM